MNWNQEIQKRIEQDFKYHSPTEQMVVDMTELRDKARLLAHSINILVPDGREKSTALTKLEEAIMHSNAGIVRDQKIE